MFGTLKNNLDSVLVNTYNNKLLFKNAFHTLMGALKENKQTREFFVLYSQVENKNFEDKSLAEEYLNQVIKTLKVKKGKLHTSPLKKSLNKFTPYIKEGSNKIYKDLDLLIFNENVTRIEDRVKSKKSLIAHLSRIPSIQLKESKVPNSLLINLATKKFNEKFNGLSSMDKKKFQNLYSQDESTLCEEYKKNMTQTLNKLDKLIADTSDNDLIIKLKETKHKINEGTFSKNSLLKIKELNTTLL